MSDDVLLLVDTVQVVEVIASLHAVTEVVGLDAAGLVEVHDSPAVFVEVAPFIDVVEVSSADLLGPAGPPGPPGVVGPLGPIGPVGPFAPVFEQTFAAPLSQWVINHNMDVFPVVSLYDLYGFEISGDVSMPDRNTVVVNFAMPFAGTARLKA